MAYNKRTWATGNVVGAVDLNRMEGGIEENHPGYECTTSLEEVFSESGATTKEEGGFIARYALDYATTINADEIKVVFNGTEYICPKMTMGNSVGYGSSTPNFEDYPFMLGSGSNSNQLFTPDPMDFEITVFVPVTTATVTPCFETAVKTVMDGKGVKVIHIEDGEESGFICDTSCDEILEILQNGGYVVASYYGEFYNLDTIDVDLMSETPSAPIRSKAPLLKSEESGSTITFAKVVINTDTQQAEIKGFTFDTSDCSITYFPNSL